MNHESKKEVITDIIIPVLNEEASIGLVIDSIPKTIVRNIIVVDNGSTDGSQNVASKHGAIVLSENERGYGAACLKGISYINELPSKPDIVAFIDGDHSDHAEELPSLLFPIVENEHDLVIGSRALGKSESGSLTPQQIFGNRLATRLLKLFYGVTYSDLGPFRAIGYKKLTSLGMRDRNYGWTVEMQLKAAKQKLKTSEVPVSYRKRIGKSKVSGTFKGSVMAGYKIIFTIFKYI